MKLLTFALLIFAQAAVAEDLLFEQFPAELYTGETVHSVNLSGNSEAATFQTRLEYALEQDSRFAGHFAFAEWGCGTSCQMSAIVELPTGKVYLGPVASLGFEYRADSRLLITNPPENIGEIESNDPICDEAGTQWAVVSHYYEWNGKEFIHLQDVNQCDERDGQK